MKEHPEACEAYEPTPIKKVVLLNHFTQARACFWLWQRTGAEMVVAARLRWVRQSIIDGAHVSLRVGPAAAHEKCKVKIFVEPSRTPMHPVAQNTLLCVLDAISASCAMNIVVDRGHKHSGSDRSELALWLAAPPGAPTEDDNAGNPDDLSPPTSGEDSDGNDDPDLDDNGDSPDDHWHIPRHDSWRARSPSRTMPPFKCPRTCSLASSAPKQFYIGDDIIGDSFPEIPPWPFSPTTEHMVSRCSSPPSPVGSVAPISPYGSSAPSRCSFSPPPSAPASSPPSPRFPALPPPSMDPVKYAEQLNKETAAELRDDLRRCLDEHRGKIAPAAFRALERRLQLKLEDQLNQHDAALTALVKNHQSAVKPTSKPKPYMKFKPVTRR